ncbi:hypothetical protein FSARC_14655 [Fusarium sarcochroum]|uniref:Apple domain-containing protein n=1 Tax=Fusarium sarcochroum TaxID=1208366 RepID=A0A8H4SRR8_9HYPO|nr:hypothetical protein FSARC_14655 [Fusarium sarcochroum]
MKLQNVLVLFTTAASATAPPTCKGSTPSYCKYTSNRDANQCRQLFGKSYINVATCQPPAKTVTSTRTNCVTSVTTKTLAPPPATKKVFKITTKTGKPTTQPTITLTATSTKIDTTTLIDSSTITEVNTVTDTETDTITNTKTITITSTSTTTVPFAQGLDCTAKKRAVQLSRSNTKKPLPTSCSCFLTSTKPAAIKTATVTKNKPAVTRTVYKIGGPRKTTTRTITVIHYAAGPTLSAPETTKTITTAITQTDRSLTTITDAQTLTATENETETETVTETDTESETATATASPCDDLNSLKSSRSLSSGDVVLTGTKDARGPDGPASCCDSCFGRPNCAFFRVGSGICEIFSTRNGFTDACSTPQCPRGFPSIDLGASDGKDYYLGTCVGGFQA